MAKKDNEFKTATILFADLVGSSDVASIKDDPAYIDHLKIFRKIVTRSAKAIFRNGKLKSTKKYLIEPEVNVKGDEGLFIIASEWDKPNAKRDTEIKVDLDGDGKADIILKDTDGDGKVDKIIQPPIQKKQHDGRTGGVRPLPK